MAVALDAMAALETRLERTRDLQAALEATVEAAVQALGADAGVVGIAGSSADVRLPRVFASCGLDAAQYQQLRAAPPDADGFFDVRAVACTFHTACVVELADRSGGTLGRLAVWFRGARPASAADDRVLELCGRRLADFVERKRTRERLRQSEARYYSLIDETNTGFIQATPDGRIFHVNRCACEMLGYSEAELLRLDAQSLVAAESRATAAEGMARLAAGESGVTLENRYRRKDGSQFWASCSVSALRDDAGQLQSTVAVIVDLGERERAENLQRGLREVLERLAHGESSPAVLDGLMRVIERASTTGLRGAVLLLDDDDNHGARLRVAAAPSLPVNYAHAIEGMAYPDAPIREPAVSGCDPGGALAPFRPLAAAHGLDACGLFPILSSHGDPLGLLLVHQTDACACTGADRELVGIAARTAALAVERTRVEDALRESERRFRTMADHAPVMIWVTEADGRCSYLSQSWHDFTGRDPNADDSDGWLDAVHEDDRARVLTVYRMAQTRRRPVRFEYRLRRHDGQYRWVLDAAAPRIGDDGTLLGFIGSVLEIDDHRRRERNSRFAARLQSSLAQLDDAGAILDVAADRICRYFELPTLLFAELDESGQDASAIHAYDIGGRIDSPQCLADVLDDALLPPVRAGQTVTVHDVSTDPRTAMRLSEYRERGIGALLVMPYPNTGPARFMLVAQDGARRDWREDERELLQELTARVHMRLERARATLMMRQSREQYRALFESIDEGFCVIEMQFDDDGRPRDYRHLEANPAFERHTGLRGALGRTMREMVPQHEEHWFRTFGEVQRSGRPVRFEAQARSLQRWLDVYAFRIGEPSEHKVALLVSDITGRKQTEDALRRNEERLRLALVTGRLGSWQLDLLTMDFTCTALCKSHFGLPPDVSLGYARLWNELVHPDDRDAMQQAIRGAIEQRRDYDAEYRVIWPDGSVHWIVSRGRAAYDAAGRATALAGVTLDITERKQTEDALREADRRKDEFIATLAHELRNPLAPLRHCLHILQMDTGGITDVGRLHAMMDRQVRHLVRLVDDLLEVSRISRGKIELRTEPVDLAQVIQHAVDTSRPLIDAGRHALELDLAPAPLQLDADPMRLAQVFSNLLNNAAKYTPPGGRIEVSALADAGDAVIRVRDTGVGIAVEMLPRVFDMFSQATHSLGQAQGGLGIGLTLVRNLVELHGGSVAACSAGLGMGSEFVVRLPLCANAGCGEPLAEDVAPAGEASARRVLIIDDNRESADSLAMFLRLCGKDVHVAYDGNAGIEAAARLRPDVMLVDLGMPGRDGFEVCMHVRAQPWGERIAMFAVTGWGQQADRERSERSGFDGHVVKPVDPDALLAKVDEAFRLHQERALP